jgi:hypothetical protein
MGGYYGSPASVMKNNKAQRRTERTPTDWRDYVGAKDVPTEEHIQATPELLAQIRKKYRKQRIYNIIVPILLTFIFFGILYYFFLRQLKVS